MIPLVKKKELLAQLCPAHCDYRDCSLPGSSVHGILQARILEWNAMPSSRGSSQPREGAQVSHIAGRFFTIWTTLVSEDFPGGSDRKAPAYNAGDPSSIPGLGRSPGEGNGNPLQYSCLENPMDGGTW